MEWLVFTLCASVCLITGPARAEDADLISPARDAQGQGFEQRFARIRELSWDIYDNAKLQPPDSRHRTVHEDLLEWIVDDPGIIRLALPPQVSAVRPGINPDRMAGPLAQEPLNSVLDEQERRVWMISWYWFTQYQLTRARYELNQWLSFLPAEIGADSRKKVAQAEADFARGFDIDATREIAVTRATAVLGAFDAERQRVATLASERILESGHAVSERDRLVDCQRSRVGRPEPSELQGLPADGEVRPVHDLPAGAFYPPSAIQMSATGVVRLRLLIGPDGCMEHAEVIGSSGLVELDEAAIRMAEYASYLPKRRDGKAVRDTVPRDYEFQLK